MRPRHTLARTDREGLHARTYGLCWAELRSPNPCGLTQESVGPLQGINNLVATISMIFTYL
jgi:hypothetical protein